MPTSAAAVDQKRRLDLAVAVLARVEIEHEVDERARRAARRRRSGPRSARPAMLRRPLEVDDAERGPRSQCAFGSKSNARGSPCVRTSTLSAALLPTGTAGVRQVRQHQQRLVALMLDRFELDAELLDLLRARAIGLLDRPSCLVPCRLARAISSPDVFCSRFRPSISGMSRRRAVSSVAISSSALSGSSPRFRRPVRTSSM